MKILAAFTEAEECDVKTDKIRNVSELKHCLKIKQ